MSEPSYYHIASSGKLTRKDSLVEALLASSIGGYIWIHAIAPSTEDLKPLIPAFDLPKRFLDACAPGLHPPSFDLSRRCAQVLFHAHRFVQGQLQKAAIVLWIGEKFLVSVGPQNESRWNPFTDIEETIVNAPNEYYSPPFLTAAIINQMLDITSTSLINLSPSQEESESVLLESQTAMLRIQRSLTSQTEVFKEILQGSSRFFPEEAFEPIRECNAHLALCLEAAFELQIGLSRQSRTAMIKQTESAVRSKKLVHLAIRMILILITVFVITMMISGLLIYPFTVAQFGSSSWIPPMSVLLVTMIIGWLVNRIFPHLDRNLKR